VEIQRGKHRNLNITKESKKKWRFPRGKQGASSMAALPGINATLNPT
jgi:hypothetical protein